MSEGTLINMLIEHPELIEPDLLIIQEDPKGVGGIDLLGISKDGRLNIIEVKKGTVNALAFGQALGYAIKVDRYPREKIFLIKEIAKEKKETVQKRCSQEGAKKFPKIILVGRNVAGSVLDLQDNIYYSKQQVSVWIEVEIISIRIWKTANGIYIRKQLHKHDVDPHPADRWEEGDIGQDLESQDTDEPKLPIKVIKKLDDGRLEISPIKRQNDGKWRQYGRTRIVPFLANYKRLSR